MYLPPRVSDGREWTFWQYSHRDRLDGYDGEESFIDVNVFRGDLDDLAELLGLRPGGDAGALRGRPPTASVPGPPELASKMFRQPGHSPRSGPSSSGNWVVGVTNRPQTLMPSRK